MSPKIKNQSRGKEQILNCIIQENFPGKKRSQTYKLKEYIIYPGKSPPNKQTKTYSNKIIGLIKERKFLWLSRKTIIKWESPQKFSIAMLSARRKLKIIIKRKTSEPRILYPTKLTFKCKGSKLSPTYENLENGVATTPFLQIY